MHIMRACEHVVPACVRMLCVRAHAHYSAPTFMRSSLTSASSRDDAATKLSSSTATLTCRITCARASTHVTFDKGISSRALAGQ